MSAALTQAQANRANQAFSQLSGGNVAGALAMARSLRAEAPGAADAQQLLALCLSADGDLPGAHQAFLEALRIAPNQPVILGNFGKLLRQMGRAAEARAPLRQAIALAPKFAPAWVDLGQVALELGAPAEAVEALERAVALQPGSSRNWHLLGTAAKVSDDLEKAEQAFRQALSIAPDSASAWINLGGVLRLLGRPVESLECCEQAQRNGASGPEFADSTIGALIDAGEIGRADARARQLIADYPSFVDGHVTLAHFLWEYGARDGSTVDPLNQFRAAAAAQPEHHALQVKLVGFLLGARMADEALERIQALRQQVDDPILTTFQANALAMLGRPDEAGQLYELAYRALGDSDPNFLNAYVRHLLTTGDPAAAAKQAEHALSIDPDNQEALAYLATAWRLLEDPREDWLCDYERTIALLPVERPAEFASDQDFLSALEHCLLSLHKAQTEPVLQTLRLGTQTPGRLFGRPQPPIPATQQALRRTVERWVAAMPDDAKHPFFRRKAELVRFTGSWSVKLRSNGNHINHMHPQGWMSSAYYVALPPSVSQSGTDKLPGQIQFGQPPLELGLDLPPRRIIKPKIGNLALFPSYMWHGTIPFADECPRLTIAFDIVPGH